LRISPVASTAGFLRDGESLFTKASRSASISPSLASSQLDTAEFPVMMLLIRCSHRGSS
jgi:hypothetical protein